MIKNEIKVLLDKAQKELYYSKMSSAIQKKLNNLCSKYEELI